MSGIGLKTAALSLVSKIRGPTQEFHSNHYLRHNARRLEHLASLRISVAGMSVLEVGAGIGDHTHFYIDRGCTVTMTDAREENLALLRRRYPSCSVHCHDMDSPRRIEGAPFELVHCYGLLYHLSKPSDALTFLSENASRMLFLETCVSFGEDEDVHLTGERRSSSTQAYSGVGCRPSRGWLLRRLSELFEYVYVPRTQPCHNEFPLDWTNPESHSAPLQRAVFIASRLKLDNDILSSSLLMHQARQL